MPIQFKDFLKKYEGFTKTLYETLSQITDPHYIVENKFEDVYKAMLSKFPPSDEFGVLVDDVIFVIEKLPLKPKTIKISKRYFRVKVLPPTKKSNTILQPAFKSIDKQVLKRIWGRSPSAIVSKGEQTPNHIDTISEEIRAREQALEEMLIAPSTSYQPSGDTTFLIARLWNSWYPSFFDVPGGCYAIIPPKPSQAELTEKSRVIVVDPGFRFLEVLKENFGIGVPEIGTIIVSHFHPDHVGGLFEYIALQHTYHKRTDQQAKLYLNSTCEKVFPKLSNAFDVKTLPEDKEITILEDYNRHDELMEDICLKPFKTHHWEMGQDNKSLGFIISVETRQKRSSAFRSYEYPRVRRIAIVGDTAYSSELSKIVYSADVLVFHLGSFQQKESKGRGKHLYAKGLLQLLTDCGTHIRESSAEKTKIVLISELGLEHAISSYITKRLTTKSTLPSSLKTNNDRDYIGIISNILNKEAKEWADVYIPGLGAKVELGKEIKVHLAPTNEFEV